MIGEICAEIKNFFTYENDRYVGDWKISNGAILPTLNFPTKYFRITGSRLNDGVHEITQSGAGLVDENFHGAIWIMSPPEDFLALCAEIKEWQTKNGAVDSSAMSPFASESFGGYSYSKGYGADGSANGTWKNVYASRLNRYRRIREL
jgi:hypothetical protein